jgi:hypothetical protein
MHKNTHWEGEGGGSASSGRSIDHRECMSHIHHFTPHHSHSPLFLVSLIIHVLIYRRVINIALNSQLVHWSRDLAKMCPNSYIDPSGRAVQNQGFGLLFTKYDNIVVTARSNLCSDSKTEINTLIKTTVRNKYLFVLDFIVHYYNMFRPRSVTIFR